jgi:acyl transferase domain-containing protein
VPCVPRELVPKARSPQMSSAGTSSFGMSGVNAHALMRSAAPAALAAIAPMAWKRDRHVLVAATDL